MKNILMLLFMSLVFIACGGEEDKKDSSSRKWSKDDREMFSKENCEPNGISDAQCNCIAAELSRDYNSYEKFKDKIESIEGMVPEKGASADSDAVEWQEAMEEMRKFEESMRAIGELCRDKEPENDYDSISSNKDLERTLREIVRGAQTYYINEGELPADCWETLMDYGYVQWRPEFDSSSFECSWYFDDAEGSIDGFIVVYSGGDVCEYDIASEDLFCK